MYVFNKFEIKRLMLIVKILVAIAAEQHLFGGSGDDDIGGQ